MIRPLGWRHACRLAALCFVVFVASAVGQAGGGPSGAGGAGGGAGGGPTGGNSGGAPGAAAPSEPVIEGVPPLGDPFHDYFLAKKQLEDRYGTRIGLNIDLLDQSVFHGPGSPESRYVARYDLGVHQKLWQDAEADMDVRGGWGDGIDVDYGNTVNTNQYANTGSHIFVLHLWLQQKLFDGQLTLRGGKMDVGDFIDVNRFGYYNFVGYSFAHNSSIPLPGNPLAAMFTFAPNDAKWVYFSGAVGNGTQNSFQAGFNDIFDGKTALFTLGELGFKTHFFEQDGVYRFEGWWDERRLPSIDGTDRNDGGRAGFALSFDQNITKDFGVFARWGYGNQDEFTPQQYWSLGFDWTSPIPSRPKDDFAIGVVQNLFSSQRDAVVNNPTNTETYLEAYYSIILTQYLQVQPIFQFVTNPGGMDRSTELIAGVHIQLRF